MKQTIKLTESELKNIIISEVKKVLNEGLFDIFKKKNGPIEPSDETNEEQNHIYSVKEMQWLYDNQQNLTPLQQKVLNAGMWVRARQANYHGYAEKWPNIRVKDGEIFYWDKGQLRKVYH